MAWKFVKGFWKSPYLIDIQQSFLLHIIWIYSYCSEKDDKSYQFFYYLNFHFHQLWVLFYIPCLIYLIFSSTKTGIRGTSEVAPDDQGWQQPYHPGQLHRRPSTQVQLVPQRTPHWYVPISYRSGDQRLLLHPDGTRNRQRRFRNLQGAGRERGRQRFSRIHCQDHW